MSLRGWEKLTCGNSVQIESGMALRTGICGSEDFIAVHRLTWHEGQGTANKQDAWKCAKCGAVASTGKMIEAIQKKHLQDQIKELEAQQNG
jgi:hypothetical protein